MLRCNISLSQAIIFSVLGPLALAGAWLYALKKQGPPHAHFFKRSLSAIILSSALIIILFYILFIYKYHSSALSGDLLVSRMSIAIIILGFCAGLLLAALTRRVAFLEACWCTFFFALYALSLSEWAYDIFSFGTSRAYFSTLLLSASFLLLLFLSVGGSLGFLFFGEGRINLRFSFEGFIGTRFLMTKRSSQVVSLITVISIIAVMIACAGMIVVMGVMDGFTSDFRSKILGANAHLMLLKYGKDFSEYDDLLNKTASLPGIISANAFVINEGLVSSKKNVSGALIKGVVTHSTQSSAIFNYISKESIEHLENPELIPQVHDGEALQNISGVIIGKEMALELQVMVGDVINIISPVGEIGPTGAIPKARPFRIAGFFDSGMYEYDAKFVFIKLSDAQSFFNLDQSVTGIEYKIDDIEKTRSIALDIDRISGGYPFYTRDWMQMNRNMFAALQLEKIVMLIILGTLIFMASLLILVTLIMVVMEKGKEIAILKSMGTTDASIMKIFVSYGIFVGALGAILGGALGFALCLFIQKVGIQLDPDVYYFSHLPVSIVKSEIALVIMSAIVISFLATIPPSLFAARLKPVEGLRYE
jgi:lipoprotein-releasing system permease protein